MGSAQSEEAEPQPEEPQGHTGGSAGLLGSAPTKDCDVVYLNWLLSETSRVHEAFVPVWKACAPDDQAEVGKSRVLDVMLKVLKQFDSSLDKPTSYSMVEQLGFGGGTDASDLGEGRIIRQLRQVVDLSGERLRKEEVLHIFRTLLLSEQTNLSMKAALPSDWNLDSPVMLPPKRRGKVSQPSSGHPAPHGFAGSAMPGSNNPHMQSFASSQPGIARPPDSDLALRATARAEDYYIGIQCRSRRPHPALVGGLARFAAPSDALPSRQELEVENQELESACRVVEASAMSEMSIVEHVEAKIKQCEANGQFSGNSRPNDKMSEDAEVHAFIHRTEQVEDEVRTLEQRIRVHEKEYDEQEEFVRENQHRINALLKQRVDEESAVHEQMLKAREVEYELKSEKRRAAAVEDEIVAEESRSQALREAFENRRSRFHTAEAASRNAEDSTLRTTRRRAAAEVAARQEEAAVEEARQSRNRFAMRCAERAGALTAEITEVRSRGARAQALLGTTSTGRRVNATAQATADAEAALRSLREELFTAEQERDHETALADECGHALAELEVSRARVQGQLAGREDELRSAQRRAERNSASDTAADAKVELMAAEEEAQVSACMAELQAIDRRSGAIRRREAELADDLRVTLAAVNELHNISCVLGDDITPQFAMVLPDGEPADGIAPEALAEAWWRHSREVGSFLGESRAALLRRQAQEQSQNSDMVVMTLRSALAEAERLEAEGEADFRRAWAQRNAMQAAANQPPRGRQRDNNRERGSLQQQQFLEARLQSLGEELRQRERQLQRAEERTWLLEHEAGEQKLHQRPNGFSSGSTAGLQRQFQDFGDGLSRSGKLSHLRSAVREMEQELDRKEDVIIRLDELALRPPPEASATGSGCTVSPDAAAVQGVAARAAVAAAAASAAAAAAASSSSSFVGRRASGGGMSFSSGGPSTSDAVGGAGGYGCSGDVLDGIDVGAVPSTGSGGDPGGPLPMFAEDRVPAVAPAEPMDFERRFFSEPLEPVCPHPSLRSQRLSLATIAPVTPPRQSPAQDGRFYSVGNVGCGSGGGVGGLRLGTGLAQDAVAAAVAAATAAGDAGAAAASAGYRTRLSPR